MKLITSVNEILDNIATVEKYLSSGNTVERDYALALIKSGTCFVAYKSEGRMNFVPSRFIGYTKNTITKHESNVDKDGRDTNPVISDALKVKRPFINDELEEEYKKYCIYLGFSPRKSGSFGAKRKYWRLP